MRAGGSLSFRPPPVRLAAKRPGCMAPASGANSPSSPCAAAMHPHLSTVLYSQEVLATRTRELGAQLSKEYATSRPLVLQVRLWAAKPRLFAGTCGATGRVPGGALCCDGAAAARRDHAPRRRACCGPRGPLARGPRASAAAGARFFAPRAFPARPRAPHAPRPLAPGRPHGAPTRGGHSCALPAAAQHRSPHALPAHDTPALTAADSAAPGSLRR